MVEPDEMLLGDTILWDTPYIRPTYLLWSCTYQHLKLFEKWGSKLFGRFYGRLERSVRCNLLSEMEFTMVL